MADIKSPKVLWFKGLLFLFLGLFSAVLLLIYAPDLTVGLLLCISVWALCRAYYFAFYVIEALRRLQVSLRWLNRLLAIRLQTPQQ